MLEGININLRAMEPDDISLIHEWLNNIEFQGRYTPLIQRSKDEMKRRFSEISADQKRFIPLLREEWKEPKILKI